MLDAIVVGGGPAGLYSALLLATEGFDVTVLEEHEALGAPTHCTGVISDEITELFKIPDSVVLNRPTFCSIVAPSGRAVPFTADSERIVVIDRQRFDEELGMAAQRSGAQIHTGVRVERVLPTRDSVQVTGPNGRALEARVCILACGVGYALHRQLGLGLPSAFLPAAQLEIDRPGDSSAVEIHVSQQHFPEGFAWVVPVVREVQTHAKVGVVARGDAGASLRRFLCRRGLADQVVAEQATPVRRLLPVAPLRKTYAHRMVVVGDAAGLTKPTTGGGIFYSLLSGRFAAETLSRGLRDDRLGNDDLRTYEARWRTSLGPHLRISSYVRRLFTRLTDAELDALLQAIAAEEIQDLIRRTARFNWHGGLIRSILRQGRIKSIVLRALLR